MNAALTPSPSADIAAYSENERALIAICGAPEGITRTSLINAFLEATDASEFKDAMISAAKKLSLVSDEDYADLFDNILIWFVEQYLGLN